MSNEFEFIAKAPTVSSEDVFIDPLAADEKGALFMEKIPVEIFIAQQLRDPRYKLIITQLGVDPVAVELALVLYLRDQGIYLVTPTLAAELASRMEGELTQRRGMGKALSRLPS